MKAQFTLALLAATCMGTLTFQDKQECLEYFASQGKSENRSANFEKRCEAFMRNKKIAEEMNNNPNSLATFCPGQFADETDAEFVKNHTGAIDPEP